MLMMMIHIHEFSGLESTSIAYHDTVDVNAIVL